MLFRSVHLVETRGRNRDVRNKREMEKKMVTEMEMEREKKGVRVREKMVEIVTERGIVKGRD